MPEAILVECGLFPLCLLVAGNVSLVQDGDRCSLKELPLPKFLDQLRRSSSGLGEQRLKGQEDVVERCCELYTQARYKDGVSRGLRVN